MKIAVVGGGISGISVARMLHAQHEVVVFEKAATIGGLIKCDWVEGNLFHRVGGHVFNAKNPEVNKWFWSHFDRETEFLKARRNAKILLDGEYIGYPLENHLYQLIPEMTRVIFDEMLAIHQQDTLRPEAYLHFKDFLIGNFGPTLYNLYFGPYNQKLWRFDLDQVAITWLAGKLPMPNLLNMIQANVHRIEESEMVHATFYYAREGGSQFIINRLAEGLHIETSHPVTQIKRQGGQYRINESKRDFDRVIYCGDVRRLAEIYINIASPALHDALKVVKGLRSNGTSNLFCETDDTDLSWLYLPDSDVKAHRIIYTGNFSEANNRGSKRKTCVVEFSGKHTIEGMQAELSKLPGYLHPLAGNYEPNSYVIQEPDTRQRIQQVKELAEPEGLYLLGRFAEWEYYNMDKAIEVGMDVAERVEHSVGQ